jgi:excisionase family DNA binding protein
MSAHDCEIPDPAKRPTITVDEAAPLLSLSRSAAYEAARRGEIPVIRIGRRVIVKTRPLLELLGLIPADT